MSNRQTLIYLVLTSLFSTQLNAQPSTTQNEIFDQNIKTIIIQPANFTQTTSVQSCSKEIGDPTPLILKFDEINTEEANYYYAKIFHCDASWQLSTLGERQYLYDFNEFSIDKYEFSSNKKIPYTHFTFQIPRVKIPGNYLIMIYKDNDESHPSIIKRFFVYDKKIGITSRTSALGANYSSSEQQIEFTVDYSHYPVSDPLTEISVVIRQNHRWDNALTDLKPSFIHDLERELVYRNFNLSNNFKSGNEFRFFELTSVNYNMRNVAKITETSNRFDAYLMRDKFRGYEAYGIIEDLNGGYVIENKDYSNGDLDSEYIYTHFYLEAPDKVRDNIYVVGKLTDWKTSEENKMTFIEGSGIYTCTLLLKQGVYDYQYLVPGYNENANIIEGNHFETENNYEILVYYRHPVLRTDVLLGYSSFNSPH